MRLTCPNCGAQYEVPDDVIPQDGRDVQCSNCGTTWFQPHADAMSTDAAEADPEEVRSALNDLGETPPEDPPAPAPEPELPEQTPTPDPDDGGPSARERRQLAPEVSSVLQQEAALEAKLRADEASGLETQPDLGLDDTTDDAERRARQARARMERLRGPDETPSVEEAVAATTAAAAASPTGSRRDRLPDIDEINSSLRASSAPATTDGTAQAHTQDPPRKSGFARGFAIPLVIVTLLLLLYVNAAQISDAVPALGPTLTSYVLIVDQLRQWLSGLTGSLLS